MSDGYLENKTKTDKNVEIGRALANFDTACRDLVNLVNDQLFESSRSPYWVADEVGGICDFGDTDFLTPEEMVLILKHGISYDDYVEWREANIKHGDTKGRITLKSWLRGCRHDQSPGLLAMPTTPTMPIGPNINTIKKHERQTENISHPQTWRIYKKRHRRDRPCRLSQGPISHAYRGQTPRRQLVRPANR